MAAAAIDPDRIVRGGGGLPALFVHGSASDATTWSIQLASRMLRARLAMIAYDRGAGARSVEDHVADAAALLAGEAGRALVVGSSFGAVVALELSRSHPEQVAGAVLIEPPLAATDVPAEATALLAELDDVAAARGGPVAAERFLRTVLGDATFDGMPRAARERSVASWPQIRADSAALVAYRPRYAALAAVTAPVLLVGGERSPAYFRPTLEALRTALGRARLEIVPGAGHMLHAEAPRAFNTLLAAFADELIAAGAFTAGAP